ncbi:hypothetical protein [Actinoplanes campanulatus]|nr:hypothetical protein [Actinoplanes capillaceus]
MPDAELMTNDERLRRIEAITDSALSGLDVTELLGPVSKSVTAIR